MKLIVTGGSGFIGSAMVRQALAEGHEVLNLDKLTYAANRSSLADFEDDPRYHFVQADVADAAAVDRTFERFRPDALVHLAAESHVDRSIDHSRDFIETNVIGTHVLLEAARRHVDGLPSGPRGRFRFVHVSTDEVFGDLGESGGAFTEETPYSPRSPYSASKAASDHLVRAWGHTYGLPVLITNCSNNYGPRQFPEKLIPHMILNALAGRPLPVYGDGSQVRDWLFVEDHARALLAVLDRGKVGETYAIGGRCEQRNIDLVHRICDLLDEMRPERRPEAHGSFRGLVEFVEDRPGHDRRYAIDCSRIESELGWAPTTRFDEGLRRTVRWYLDHESWWRPILEGSYRLERIGTSDRS